MQTIGVKIRGELGRVSDIPNKNFQKSRNVNSQTKKGSRIQSQSWGAFQPEADPPLAEADTQSLIRGHEYGLCDYEYGHPKGVILESISMLSAHRLTLA